LANHASALKRARQSRVRRTQNRAYKTRAKTVVKEIRDLIESNSADKAAQSLPNAVSILQKTAARGVIHKRTAARKISRLARRANALAASAKAASPAQS